MIPEYLPRISSTTILLPFLHEFLVGWLLRSIVPVTYAVLPLGFLLCYILHYHMIRTALRAMSLDNHKRKDPV